MITIDSTHLKATARRQFQKMGGPDACCRTDQKRAEFETALDLRWAGAAADFLPIGRARWRSKGRVGADGCSAACHGAPRGKGNDADWLREGLENEGIAVCIPTRRGLRNAACHDRKLYKQRHRIERLFARLKDQRSIASLYDKCGELFPSAICIVGTVIFWL